MTKILDIDYIKHCYAAKQSAPQIAASLNVSRSTILRRLRASGTTPRTAVEASDLLRFKTFPVGYETLEFLDGLLLGDACLEYDVKSEARLELTQRKDRLSWVKAVEQRLKDLHILSTIVERTTRNSVQLRTKKYVTLTEQRTRWYPNGIKGVPKDIKLTPLSISQWYWGDGSTSRCGYKMVFNTQGFSKNDVDYLGHQLYTCCAIENRIHKNRKGFVITVATRTGRNLLVNIIKDYCPPCFIYKLKIKE